MAQEMQNPGSNILNSYESEVKEVETLRKKNAQLLENLKKQQKELSIQLREFLAKRRSLRREDFETMVFSIQIQQKEREDEVEEELRQFREEMNERKNRLREFLTRGESLRVKNFKKTITDIQAYQRERKGEIKKLLKDFQNERKNLNVQLKELLAKGESLRIKDFREMIKKVQTRQRERRDEVHELMRILFQERENFKRDVMKMLSEVRIEQEKIREEWKKITSATQKKVI